jgi:tRNA 2-selenouridine synthase
MALKKIDTELFLRLAESIPVADVRSPSEYNQGHIPGAVNIPIFNDNERAVVGTIYKKEGRIPAIIEGMALSGPSMSSKLEQAIHLSKEGKLLVHCWRGGMRSEAMAWLFSLGEVETEVLEGGYKQYRHFILENLSLKRKAIVLGGMTGSGKTHILQHLKKYRQNIVDLEGLANHKGSAFGSLGQSSQPTTEHFANLLYKEWSHLDLSQPVWLEDESRNIGSVFMPENFYSNMQDTPTIILIMDVRIRLPRLIEEYSAFPPELLIESIMRISKRLGGDNTHDAITAVEKGDFAKAIEITLTYYDKAYNYGLNKKNRGKIFFIRTDTDDVETNAGRVLEAAGMIDWSKSGFTGS